MKTAMFGFRVAAIASIAFLLAGCCMNDHGQPENLANTRYIRIDDSKDCFSLDGRDLDQTRFDFFAWWSSNLMSNATRGVLAEYIVAIALDCADQERMEEWNEYDLLTLDGLKIEVKTSAYLQSWKQRALSKIVFSIVPSRKYDYDTGTYEAAPSRKSDIYVFCLLDCVDRDIVNPLNLNQWSFFVVPTAEIDRQFGVQKSISLGKLVQLSEKLSFSQIKPKVQEIAKSLSPNRLSPQN